MDYTKRRVSCRAKGLSKEEAAESLVRSQKYANAEILSLNKEQGRWVATILVPKTAAPPPFPPKDDDSDPEETTPPKSEESPEEGDEPSPDGPPSDESEGDAEKPKPKGEKGELGELLSLVHEIAQKLGIGGPPEVPGAGDGPMPGPAAPPPPPGAGGPAAPSGAKGGLGGSKLKPGEVPNKPGVVPVGAPAFASTNGAGGYDLSRVGSFDAFDDTPGKSIKEAREELEALYGPHGFKVRQIKRVENGTRLAAKLSRR